jgi:predicted transcriptional regulator
MQNEHRCIFGVRDIAADQRAVAEAQADIAAGRVVRNALVVVWLRSWGTEQERVRPKIGE